MSLPAEQTLLVLLSNGVPLYSARNLDQTLDPIKAVAAPRRTVNGLLVDLAVDKFKKYESVITCSDVEAPAFDGVFQGMKVTVDCVAELVYRTVGGAPSRPVVDGSERVVGAFTIYRPRLMMMVTGVQQSINEYGRRVKWSLTLEETGEAVG
jgi:hypothetical protein